MVRAETARRGYKQADLRRATGIARQSMNNRWHGRTAYALPELVVIAEFLGLDLGELLAEAGLVSAGAA